MASNALTSFLGENNRLPPHKLRTEDGAFVQHAVNVDVTDAGTLQRRKGSTRVLIGSDCHSLWSNSILTLFVDYDTLYVLKKGPTDFTKSVLLTGLPPGVPMSYCDVNGEIYCSNGKTIWRINGAGITEAGIAPPTKQPKITVMDGSLPKGVYQVSVSFVSADGEESGATAPVRVEVPDNSCLVITDIDQRDGFAANVYVSPPNGDLLYRESTVAGTTRTVYTVNYEYGQVCRTLLMQPTPPGQIVRYLNGQLLVAAGKFLFYSEPYALGLYHPLKNYIPFAETITMVEPCQNGFYVSADQTYWINGPLDQADLNPVLPYRAVLGTSGQVPNENKCFWMSERGVVVGGQDGQVVNEQEKNVVVQPALAGASLFREQDGMKQVVASLFGPQQTVAAASSYMDAEVIRKETIL